MFGLRKKFKASAPQPQPTQPHPSHIMDGYGTPEWQQRNLFLLSVVDALSNSCIRYTVNSLKGGITKSTVVLGAGTALAMLRRDGITVIDANPHRGTAAERLGEEHAKTARDLLDNLGNIHRVGDMRQYTSQAMSRLEIVASEKDPERQKTFTPDDYAAVLEVVSTFRSMVLTDTGTDLLLPMMKKVYAFTDQLVVPATTAADGYRLAMETLDWWELHAPNGAELVRNAVVPLTRIEPFTVSQEQLETLPHEQLMQLRSDWQAQQDRLHDRLRNDLQQRVRAVVSIPYDTHLAKGYRFDFAQMAPATQDAFVELAYQMALALPENQRWVGMTREQAEQQYLSERARQQPADAYGVQQPAPVHQQITGGWGQQQPGPAPQQQVQQQQWQSQPVQQQGWGQQPAPWQGQQQPMQQGWGQQPQGGQPTQLGELNQMLGTPQQPDAGPMPPPPGPPPSR